MKGCVGNLIAVTMAGLLVISLLITGNSTQMVPEPVMPTPTPGVCRASGRGGTVTTPIDEAPVRSSVGTGHVLRGVVRAAPDCAPIAGAKIIFWLTNPEGKYDDDHRATVYTDENGAYTFESNYPGQYDNIRPHIHMFVAADGFRPLETEFLPEAGATEGTFDIVLAAG